MIEAFSYDSINGLKFGATLGEAIEIFGKPASRGKIRSEVEEFFYDKYRIGFDKNNKFSDFELYPQTKAKINGVEIGWTLKEILDIIKLDKDPRIDDDGITLYDLGIYIYAFDGSDDDDFSDKTISFFAKGEMDQYKEDSEPFNIDIVKQKIKAWKLNIAF